MGVMCSMFGACVATPSSWSSLWRTAQWAVSGQAQCYRDGNFVSVTWPTASDVFRQVSCLFRLTFRKHLKGKWAAAVLWSIRVFVSGYTDEQYSLSKNVMVDNLQRLVLNVCTSWIKSNCVCFVLFEEQAATVSVYSIKLYVSSVAYLLSQGEMETDLWILVG